MAQPPDYNPVFDFGDFAALNPTSPLPGASVDTELTHIQTSINAINDNLALLQRDDGELANAIVGIEQLDASVTALFAVGVGTGRGAWVTATSYAIGDIVSQSTAAYMAMVAHTSGVFATDLAAAKWVLITVGATPYILTLLDDTTAAAARATLVMDTKPNVLASTGVLSADELNTLTTDATIGAHNDLLPFVDASETNASNKGTVANFLTNSISNATDTTPAVQTDYEVLIRKISDGSLHKALLSELGLLPASVWLSGTTNVDPGGNTSDNASLFFNITVTGAVVGDHVMNVSAEGDLSTVQGWDLSGVVSAPNTVTVRAHNDSGGALNPTIQDVNAVVLKKSAFGF